MPSAAATVAAANAEIANGSLYGALKHYRKLLDEVSAMNWVAEITGVFEPSPNAAPSEAPLVIRAPRRGRPERQPERQRATAA
jgi:hypothetical protein